MTSGLVLCPPGRATRPSTPSLILRAYFSHPMNRLRNLSVHSLRQAQWRAAGSAVGSMAGHVGGVPVRCNGQPEACNARQHSMATRGAALAPSQLVLYDSLRRAKVPFVPVRESKVSMYVCGVTVYDQSHIGHARVYVAFDVVYRLLQRLGYDVTYVRNFTDVDDKIIKRASDSGEPWQMLTERFIGAFHADLARLYCLTPTHEPRATAYVPEMISMIERIMKRGHAYGSGGDVYFDVQSLEGYGSLSGRGLESGKGAAQAQERARSSIGGDAGAEGAPSVEMQIAPACDPPTPASPPPDRDLKRHAQDFALWKASKPDEPFWPSPWGKGRPGWHIECSAMVQSLLGSSVDIHGGGRDLIFPHHENERAQLAAASGYALNEGGEPGALGGSCEEQSSGSCCPGHPASEHVRYWLHNGFVDMSGVKMSKSLGNVLHIKDVLDSHHPTALRWLLLSTHYRHPLPFSPRALDEAADRMYYAYRTLLDAQLWAAELVVELELFKETSHSSVEHGPPVVPPAPEDTASLLELLKDDVATPAVQSATVEPLHELNEALRKCHKSHRGAKQGAALLTLLTARCSRINAALDLLGLPWKQPAMVLHEMRIFALNRANLSEEQVQSLVEERNKERKAKRFEQADAIRANLASRGIAIMDTPGGGTEWRPASYVGRD